MKKLTTTQEVAFGAFVFLVACIGAYVFFIKHIALMREELRAARIEIANVDKIAEKKLATISLLEETKKGREELSKYFVPDEDPTPFLELIESSARDTGVLLEVESLTEIANTEGDTGIKNVKTVLIVEGGWQNIYHFISLLEHLPFTVVITETAFSLDKKDGKEKWSGMIHLEYYAK